MGRALWTSAVVALIAALLWPTDGMEPYTPQQLATLAAFAPAVLVLCVMAVASWVHLFRFGRSRLVPDGAPLVLGRTLGAVLEANDRVAGAGEIRLELVERHRSALGAYVDRVRASAAVPSSLIRTAAGRAFVPVSLPVPADGWPSVLKSGLGIYVTLGGMYVGRQSHPHAWEVRASASVAGAAYRARFRVHVAARDRASAANSSPSA